jgi:hypothetical protein
MVPLSEKRHRLYPHEIPEVINGLILRLEKLTEERNEEEKAEITYRTLYRLMFAERGGRRARDGWLGWGVLRAL